MRSQKRTPLAVWIVLTVLAGAIQVPLVVFYHQAATSERSFKAKQHKRVVTVRMDPRKRPKKKAPAPRKVEPEEKKDLQIVTVRQPEKEVVPRKRAEYLSQHNTRVKKQQKARRRGKAARKLGAPAKKESKIQSPKSKSLAETAAPKVAEAQELPAKPVEAPKDETGDRRPKTDMLRSAQSKALLPTLDKQSAVTNIQTLTGAAASDDALLNIKEEGETTMLDSKKFMHWDFFNTVKQRVRKHWHPAKVYRRQDPTGKVYGIKDRLTVVQVTLNKQGNLQRLTTVKDSGMDFLDTEARAALTKAAPFNNPPTGLLNQHDMIVFKFGFLFEISTNRFKFFRVPARM